MWGETSMAIVGFRDACDRFSHIDASFVGTSLILPDGAQSVCVKYEVPTTEATYSVRFYPYWEHLLYQEASRAGKSPNVGHAEEDKIIVTVFARKVYEFAIERRTDVIDWGFSDWDHPLLWPYHDSVQVHCVSSLTPSQVADLIDLARIEGREYLNIPSNRAPFFGIRQFNNGRNTATSNWAVSQRPYSSVLLRISIVSPLNIPFHSLPKGEMACQNCSSPMAITLLRTTSRWKFRRLFIRMGDPKDRKISRRAILVVMPVLLSERR